MDLALSSMVLRGCLCPRRAIGLTRLARRAVDGRPRWRVVRSRLLSAVSTVSQRIQPSDDSIETTSSALSYFKICFVHIGRLILVLY